MNKASDRPSRKPRWSLISTDALVRFLLFFACGWALVELFKYFEYVFFVFALAAILALLLSYPVQYLQRFMQRRFALAIVISLSLITIVVLVIAIGLALANQIEQLTTLLLQILNSSNNPLDRLQNILAERRIPVNLGAVEAQLRTVVVSGLNWAVGSLPLLLQNYITFIIILVVAFFMLIDGEKLWRLVLKLVPREHRQRLTIVVRRNFAGFLQGQLLISVVLSIATFLVFVLFQVPFPFLLAVTVGVFDLIPGIGATLGVSLVCLVVLVQSGWITAIKVLIINVVLQQIQDNLISPRIMQSTVHLNPVVVFFALLVGTRIFGILGVFLAIPIAGVIVSLLEIEEAQGD